MTWRLSVAFLAALLIMVVFALAISLFIRLADTTIETPTHQRNYHHRELPRSRV